MIEIERKFLVKNKGFKKQAYDATLIKQGFLNTHPERTVRVRVKDDQGWITIKGLSNNSGTTRSEWEHLIDVEEANELLKICEPGIIEKTRYLVAVQSHLFEVDVFEGDNEGLIVAEVELQSEDEVFEAPSWLGIEVTGDIKYYNSNLSLHPYKNWKI
ncbi:MAG: CYTH domain-containing protein [Gilvibacter sp.]